jgi:NAD+ kinase
MKSGFMRIRIISNPKKDWAKSLARDLADHFKTSTGHKVVKTGADATICIGGDGTILYASHKGRIEGVVLGIGSDKSYICQVHRNAWRENIDAILSSGKTERTMTLEGAIGPRTFCALNDFVVHATRYRVVELDLEIKSGNQEKISKTSFEGDGLILSSSLGSTSYAYSAGGEKFPPTDRKIVVVPICPYKRTFSSVSLDEHSVASVTVGHDCAFIVDGVFVRNLKAGERLSVKKGKDMIFFSGVGKNA